MNTLIQSAAFAAWMKGLKDKRGKARILSRLDSAALGNWGDCEFIAEGVFEMRIHFGPGYRIYCKRRGPHVYLLLVGGDKGTQKRDIQAALEMARQL